VSSAHPERGDDNARVTIVEYSDFQCPYCREVEAALHQVLTKYDGQVRLVYMDFPLPFHKHAMDAAIAARCADEQGQFWPYHDLLIKNPSSLSAPELETFARQLGLDPVTFDGCLEDRKYEHAVLADEEQGKKIGANGTPYLVVGSHSMSGSQPVSVIEAAIDDQFRSTR
jgi:protein-disulfide isomerase